MSLKGRKQNFRNLKIQKKHKTNIEHIDLHKVHINMTLQSATAEKNVTADVTEMKKLKFWES